MPNHLTGQARVKAIISGVVQGVGFRPFIYQLAHKHKLVGYVTNTSTGVEIEVEGSEEDVHAFLKAIPEERPPLALISSIKTHPLTPLGEEAFLIKKSQVYAHRSTLISPDVCICEDCLREVFDPNDRRHRYPFINCTNCGPRYTIIDDIPYDRPNTSMRKFPMCKECGSEYNDPGDRRFHAQPNACFQCGPEVFLYDKEKKPVLCNDPILETIKLLEKGFIVAIKGLGGFHLAVDAENSEAVMQLRERKPRKEKPFAIMSKDLNAISQYATISQADKELLTSFKRPIVLAPKKQPNTLSEGIAPGINNFGVMLPYTPLHYLLMEGKFWALVMTSGNITEEPICIDNHEAFSRLKGIADYFLIHNRDILQRSDDSVCQIINEKVRLIRRSRGYVPLPLFFDKDLPQVLACGAEEKNTICLTKENKVFVSQHIGELENLETLQFFEHVISHLKRILEIEPKILAYDLHPQYLSTKWALEQRGVKLIGIQHHHAHILSCLAENGDFSPVIGLALDGIGYGEDGRLWGGELLLVDKARYKRLAHLSYRPLPGGEKAIKAPWRMAISYLYPIYGKGLLELVLPFKGVIEQKRIEKVMYMIERGINCPLSSGLGRLFDAVSAMIGIKYHIDYSAQAAIELEMCQEETDEGYEFSVNTKQMPWEIDPNPVISAIVRDLKTGVPRGIISGRFHKGTVNMLVKICNLAREETGLKKIALSGGVFQNAYLISQMENRLKALGFIVYSHSQVPCNDGGISLGQATGVALLHDS